MRLIDWLFCAGIILSFLLEMYHYYIAEPIWHEYPGLYEQDGEISSAMMNKTPVQVDERGIIGSLTDSNGKEYYAVVIPKEEYEQAWNETEEDENESH